MGFLSFLQGNFHQGHLRSQGNMGGNQCTAIAMIALLFAGLHMAPMSWVQEHIDHVLFQDDGLYQSVINNRYSGDDTVFLFHDDLPSEVDLLERHYSTNLLATYYGGVQTAVMVEANAYSLEDALSRSLLLSNFIIGTFAQSTVAILRNGENIWIFDSHARNFRGFVDGTKRIPCCHSSGQSCPGESGPIPRRAFRRACE